jgi:outer membrane protein assembly factor BamB
MAVVLVLVCAAPLARANDWTELGSDPQRSRGTSEISGPTFVPSWTHALGSGHIIASPVSAGGRIVIAGSNGAVKALDATSGTPIWSRVLAGGVRATPSIAGDRVVAATLAGKLYALGLADGEIAWERTFGMQNYSSPVLVPRSHAVAADTFVVNEGFPKQHVWRFDVRTGEPLWGTPKDAIAGLVMSSPAVSGNRVVVTMNGGRVQSLDLTSGATLWQHDAIGDVGLSSPLVVGDRVFGFLTDSEAHVTGVDLATGLPLPGFPVAIPDVAPVAGALMLGNGPAPSSPMTIDGLIVVQLRRQDRLPSQNPSPPISLREYVVAIDPLAATVRWQHLLAERVAENVNGVPGLNACATPAAFRGPGAHFIVVSSSITGRLSVLEAQTGQERWTTPLPSAGRSSPVFSNGQLLIATDDSVLHAFSSTSNRAPTPPSQVGPEGDVPFAASGMLLQWHGAIDPNGGALSHVVRIEEDGRPETRAEMQVPPGQEEAPVMLEANKSYLFAVRSRDADGAMSAWSPTKRVRVGDSAPAMTPPPVRCLVIERTAVQATSTTEPSGCAIAGGHDAGLLSLAGLGFLAAALRRRPRRVTAVSSCRPASFGSGSGARPRGSCSRRSASAPVR